MCVKFTQSPYVCPIWREQLHDGLERVLYLPLLGKRVGKIGPIHTSSNHSVSFPIRRFTHDPNAVVGDHSRCLHFAPNAPAAQTLTGYGDHTLVAVPSRNYWGQDGYGSGRCHHTDGAYSLFCVECEGYSLEETTLPDFWAREIPQGLARALLQAADEGAYVGQAIRRRGA